MTYKNLKKQATADLAAYNQLKRQQEILPKQIQLLQNSALYKSMDTQTRVACSADSDSKLIAHISRIENLEAQLEGINFKVQSMENALDFLSPNDKQLLQSYYINRQRQSVTSLAVEMNSERSWLYRKADRALQKYISAYFGILCE